MPDQPNEATNENKLEAAATPTPEAKPHCGIIMPISDTPGYDPGHWLQVQRLIIRAAEQAGFTATMVSENEGQDMIHASIIKNIYHNPVVVCDVSSLNPNVMLELGLRMATKKPLVLVFDSENNYPFDIKNFIYEGYPKGLHFFKIEGFVDNLAGKIKQVYEAEKQGNYKPYLSHFNDVVIEESKLDVSTQTITDTLLSLASDVKGLKVDLQMSKNKYDRAARSDKMSQNSLPLHPLTLRERAYLDVYAKQYINRYPDPQNKLASSNDLLSIIEEEYLTISGAANSVDAARRFQAACPLIKDYIQKKLSELYASN
jgi:hypothetical protein